ncbi:MAG: orotidine-5'-phosphate decarboxylase [Proteobacteria bacterium]|nr:orotidine-5'-phosphate decarboxylase [Pseudomonadota bacterium]
MEKIDPRVIVALDVNNIEEVRDLVTKVGKNLKTFKVGMRLFTKYGPSIVKELKDKGYDVFLDLKYHDIPNTVETACKEAAGLGVDMLTIHTSGGREMCKAAVNGARDGASKSGKKIPIVLGVTVLTSMNETLLKEIGINNPVDVQVINLANMAISEGVGGVVCSPLEVKKLKTQIKKDFIAVIPGIRLPENNTNDQKRVASPDTAIADGADYLVIGRPVYGAPDPVKALKDIYTLMAKVNNVKVNNK